MGDVGVGRSGQLRIVFLISSLARGGAQRQAVLTAAGLRRRGHDVTFVVLRSGGALETELRGAGVPTIDLGSRGGLSGVWARAKALRLRSVRDADVVYSFLPEANVTSALIGFRRRRPAIVWGVRDSGMVLRAYGVATRVVAWASRLLARRADLIVCNSHAARRYYTIHGYPDRRMCVIPNGIDVVRFRIDPEARRVGRAQRGLDEREEVVLCLARADPMKGHVDLIEAFGIVAVEYPRSRLLLVGDHNQQFARHVAELAERSGVAGRIVLEQGTDTPERLIPLADVLVLPSRYGEGFPNVLAEALACGLPVVTTDVGDAAVVVGDHGLVVPPGDPRRLAEAIGSTLKARNRAGMADLADRIQREFSIEALLDRTECAVLSAVAGR